MLKYLQKFLGRLGYLESRYFYVFVIFILLITGLAFVGMTRIEYESDFNKFNPENIPIIELQEKIDSQFPSFSSFLVIVQLDDNIKSDITDIRDPKVIEFLIDLQDSLNEEQKIQSVNSVGAIFQNGVPDSLEGVKSVLSQIPGSKNFFNSRYSLTPVFISADISEDSEKINEINDRVKEIIESSSKPGGVKAVVTGEPPLFARIFDLMIQDGIFTLILATIVIFIMLLIIQRSVKDSVVIILPVLFGVAWTLGGLGWFNIKITIATAAIGAMLLGLGVEYSIFLNSRYKEERNNRVEEGLIKALSTTGASTFSSGVTTMIGFFALTLSLFPILSELGFSLGLGIALILTAVMTTGPLMIIFRDRIFKSKEKKEKKKTRESLSLRLFEKHGKFVSERPFTVIFISIGLTLFLFYGSSLIQNEEIDFDTILPDNLEELQAFNLLSEEFQDTTSVLFYIELDPTYPNSNEPTDIRDPRIIKYIDVLSQKAQKVKYVESVNSVSFLEKEINNGTIPGSLAEQKKILEKIETSRLITQDYSATVVRIILHEDVLNEDEEIIKQLYEIIDNTEKPIGIITQLSGGIVVNYELNKFLGPDSSKTAIVAFVLIIIFLFLASRSVKYTILPLVTVVVAIVWILGMVGYFSVGWNEIISSVLSMTIGIGIDFGIQLSNRFKQELVEHEKKEAMKRTLKYTLYPMIITVVAALIGFQAMNFGQLKLMGDLGKTMSFGMVSSMIVAVTLVASLMLIFERKSHKSLKIKKQRLLNGRKK